MTAAGSQARADRPFSAAGPLVAPDEDPGDGPSSTVSRRSFLKGLAAGGATVAVIGTGALSYRVYDQAILGPDEGVAFEPWRRWRDTPGALGAVAAAILAANPHNTQPWRFDITDERIDLHADMTRHTQTLDPAGRELHLGLGCAIENLTIAARAKGLAPTVRPFPDTADADLVARIALDPARAEPSALYDAIGHRHTNRGPFQARPVSSDILHLGARAVPDNRRGMGDRPRHEGGPG